MGPLFLTVYLIWFLSEILLNRLVRAGEADKKGADKQTLSLIWLTIVIVVTVGINVSYRTNFTILNENRITYVGLILIITGILLRFAAIRSLGKQFTVDVTIRKDHALKTDGMYTYIRHPSYSASLLSFIGFGLSLNNWLSLLIVTVPILLVFMVRIKVEEKVLLNAFGDEYKTYMTRTKRIIPGIF